MNPPDRGGSCAAPAAFDGAVPPQDRPRTARRDGPVADAAARAAGPGQVAFFGHDRAEPTIRKRIDAIQDAGWGVVEYVFVRVRSGLAIAPAAQNTVPLGQTIDRNYAHRLPLLALGVARALRRWRDLRAADVIYVRNLDMALVAWASARLAGSRAPLSTRYSTSSG
ncbi:hypothetical protein ACRAWG_09260 [Methylobacterium sp. P31]